LKAFFVGDFRIWRRKICESLRNSPDFASVIAGGRRKLSTISAANRYPDATLKDSIYRWIERRNLPAHRIGRLWKFKVSEVDDWVRNGGANSHQRVKADEVEGEGDWVPSVLASFEGGGMIRCPLSV
jgi:excisionase family DNA binding protein